MRKSARGDFDGEEVSQRNDEEVVVRKLLLLFIIL